MFNSWNWRKNITRRISKTSKTCQSLLKKRIDVTNIRFTNDKRTFICLMMTLTQESNYRSFIQIWNVISNITTIKTRVMLLKKFRQSKHIENMNKNNVIVKKIESKNKFKQYTTTKINKI